MSTSESSSLENEKSHVHSKRDHETPAIPEPLDATGVAQPAEDIEEMLYLPYRTLTGNARMTDFTNETAEGQVLRQIQSNKTGKLERFEVVTFKVNDSENPKNWTKPFKWYVLTESMNSWTQEGLEARDD